MSQSFGLREASEEREVGWMVGKTQKRNAVAVRSTLGVTKYIDTALQPFTRAVVYDRVDHLHLHTITSRPSDLAIGFEEVRLRLPWTGKIRA